MRCGFADDETVQNHIDLATMGNVRKSTAKLGAMLPNLLMRIFVLQNIHIQRFHRTISGLHFFKAELFDTKSPQQPHKHLRHKDVDARKRYICVLYAGLFLYLALRQLYFGFLWTTTKCVCLKTWSLYGADVCSGEKEADVLLRCFFKYLHYGIDNRVIYSGIEATEHW